MTGHLKAEIVAVEVDNPYFSADHPEAMGNLRRVRVAINKREAEFGGICLEEHQVLAAKRFRRKWEVFTGIKGESLSDRINNGHQRSYSDQILAAGQEIRNCRRLLGWRSYGLVVAVCGEGRQIADMFPVKHGGVLTSEIREERKFAAANLRNSLDDMAGMWKLMQPQGIDRLAPTER